MPTADISDALARAARLLVGDDAVRDAPALRRCRQAAARRRAKLRRTQPRRCSTARARCRAPTTTTTRSAWYHKVVAAYPHTPYAAEAQFLSGWLEFNRGHYKEAIAPLEDSLARYPSGKWVDDSLWFLGMSHYFLGEWDAARDKLAALANATAHSKAARASTGSRASISGSSDRDAAVDGYKATVSRVSILVVRAARARRGSPHSVSTIGPFGKATSSRVAPSSRRPSTRRSRPMPLIERADELIAAGMGVDAGRRARARR